MTLLEEWDETVKMVAENELFDTSSIRPLIEELRRLATDNARLRELISEAMRQKFMTNPCPWCRVPLDSIDDEHEADLPSVHA